MPPMNMATTTEAAVIVRLYQSLRIGLTKAQHNHHDLSVATLHLHVGEHDCLEAVVLKSSVEAREGVDIRTGMDTRIRISDGLRA